MARILELMDDVGRHKQCVAFRPPQTFSRFRHGYYERIFASGEVDSLTFHANRVCDAISWHRNLAGLEFFGAVEKRCQELMIVVFAGNEMQPVTVAAKLDLVAFRLAVWRGASEWRSAQKIIQS